MINKLCYLQKKLFNILNRAKAQEQTLDVTQICFDLLSQYPYLEYPVTNTTTLSGESLETLPSEDRYYLREGAKIWLFSLENISQWIDQGKETNPYTQNQINPLIIASIKRCKANKPYTDIDKALIGEGETLLGERESPLGEWETASAASSSSEDENEDEDEDDAEKGLDDSLDEPNLARVTDMRRVSSSFDIPHKVTEFLQTISYLGFYPDVNGFKELQWRDIVRFVHHLLHNWESFSSLLDEPEKARLDILWENHNEEEQVRPGEQMSLGQVSPEDIEISDRDKKMIVRFLQRTVTQGDGEDESRALVFTTELANYLEPSEIESELDSSEPAFNRRLRNQFLVPAALISQRREEGEGERTADVDEEEISWETLLDRVGQAPEDDTFLRSVRYIIEHIVNLNTHSLSSSSSEEFA